MSTMQDFMKDFGGILLCCWNVVTLNVGVLENGDAAVASRSRAWLDIIVVREILVVCTFQALFVYLQRINNAIF